MSRTFDPDNVTCCEEDLIRLLLVHPSDRLEALQLSQSLLHCVGVLVFDNIPALCHAPTKAATLAAKLAQLPVSLNHSNCAFITLTPF